MKKKVKILPEIAERFDGYYPEDFFLRHAREYISALREGRLCCVIDKVSRTGTSRQVRVFSLDKIQGTKRFSDYHYTRFIQMFGYKRVKNNIVLRGVGLNVIHAMNEYICGKLRDCGMLSLKEYRRYSEINIHEV